MIHTFDPKSLAPPALRSSHCAEVSGVGRWFYIFDQVGVTAKGELKKGHAGQLDQCFANVEAALPSGGTYANSVKLTSRVTIPRAGAVATYRSCRDQWLAASGHMPTASHIIVSELAGSYFLAEVEAIAASIT